MTAATETKSQIIAVANHKGGSGKTTTAYYLGLALASAKRSVLLIDLDDQGTLTSRLHAGAPPQTTIADVLDGRSMSSAYFEHDHHAAPLAYIAADHRLAWIAARLQASSPNHAFLRQAWQRAAMKPGPDYVLLDCPPNAGVLLINALALADYVLIPATPTEESYAGLLRMEAMVDEISAILNHDVRNLGVVATMVSPASASEQHYLAQMDGALIGRIPRRVGRDADAHLRAAYADVATAIMRQCEEASC
jgi:chromosome partitioning protein